jgi:hypothetical protein
MSAERLGGSGIEITSANAARNWPASVSGNFMPSNGIGAGQRIADPFCDWCFPSSLTPYVDNTTEAVLFGAAAFSFSRAEEVATKRRNLVAN